MALGYFIWVWLAVALINFGIGVFVADISVVTEIGVFLIIFGVPTALAWCVSKRMKSV